MKRTLIILTLLLYSLSAFCQKQNRYKWIIIDTIIVADNYANNTHHFMLDQNFCHIRYQTKSGKDTTFTDEYYEEEPEYGATFFLQQPPYRSGSSEIMQVYLPENIYIKSFSLKIDDKASEIKFEDLPNKDTFHISKWTINHNCLQDSIHSSAAYYNYNKGKLVNMYKRTEKNNIAPKSNCTDVWTNYAFTMNGIRYDVPLIFYNAEVLTWSHGAPDQKNIKKKERDPNSKHKRVAIQDQGIIRYYNGTVSVSN